MKRKKSRKEETRGRPARPLAEPIPDTPENIIRAILGTPPISGVKAGSCYLSL